MEEKTNADGAKKRPRAVRSETGLKRLALGTLTEMIRDDALKPADRLSAVKLLLDYLQKQPAASADTELHVIFDNMPEGYAD